MTTPPAVAGFTAINAGGRTTTSTDSYGGIYMVATDGASAADIRLLKIAKPAGAYTFTVHLVPTFGAGAKYPGAGICLRASGTGNIRAFGLVVNLDGITFGPASLFNRLITASGTGASPTFTTSTDRITVTSCPLVSTTGGIWLRVSDDNTTNRVWSISADGINWIVVLTEGRTVDFTADEIGLWISPTFVAAAQTQAAAWFNSYVAA